MNDLKIWTKPEIEIFEARLATLHSYANKDGNGGLKGFNNQPS